MPEFLVDTDKGRGTMKRVVITGLGLVTPLGTGVEKNWTGLLEGRSGIGPITRFDVSDFPTQIGGEVKDFVPEEFIEKREIKKMDPFIQYAYASAQMAMDEAGLPITSDNEDLVGVIVGVGIGGLSSIESYHKVFLDTGLKKVSPFFIPKLISNLAPGQIAIRYGAKGVNYTPTSACSSGSHAIGEAFRLIRLGEQQAVIAGGAEAALTPMGLGGFIAMKAVSTHNDEPDKASRPFDKRRDGFVMAEGAGMVVMEELECARRRGAKIYAEVVGYGANCDAHHMTAPLARGRRRGPLHAAGAAQREHSSDRDRLYQRPRHVDAVQRRHRDPGHQTGVWRACRTAGRQFHQIHDRSPARCRRRSRGGVCRPGPRPGHPAADH